MVINGWTLLFHEAIIGQLRNLADASARARKAVPDDSQARIIVYVWVNGERSLRQRGGKNDPYEVFRRMLAR
jgi:hypothetical protein